MCCHFAGKPIIKLRPFRAQAVHLPTNVRGPISHHRGGAVGANAAGQAPCDMLCLTLWARPERADEVPGEKTFPYRKKLLSCATAAVCRGGFSLRSYYYCYYCCSCSSSFLTFSIDRLRVRQSVRYPSIGLVVKIMYISTFCDHINILHIFDHTCIVLKSG